jgi:hypothetical protein
VELGRKARRLVRHSLPEFQTTGRSREDDDEYENDKDGDAIPPRILTQGSIFVKISFDRKKIPQASSKVATKIVNGSVQSSNSNV